MEEEEFNQKVGESNEKKGASESRIEDAYGESHNKEMAGRQDISGEAIQEQANGTVRVSEGSQMHNEPDSDSKTQKAKNPF